MRILVVGSGPVGLMFCAKLSREGHECVLIERHDFNQTFSRASTLQPATLELLSEFACWPELLAQGEVVSDVMSWNLERSTQQRSSYDVLSAQTRFPYRLHLHQAALRAELIAELQASRCCCLVDKADAVALQFDRCKQGVSLRVNRFGSSGLSQTFQGDYLILCDGARSVLRDQLGLRFEGYDLPTPVVRLSVPMIPDSLQGQLAGVSYVQSEGGSVSCLKMTDGWRFVLRPRLSELRQALAGTAWARQRLAGVFRDCVPAQWWESIPAMRDSYRVAQRCVKTRQVQRVFLLGDVAHVTNTRGGLNMNFGLIEAYALASCFLNHPDWQALQHWNLTWSRLTQDALMARTQQLLAGRTPRFLRSSSESFGALMRASLLDLLSYSKSLRR